MSDNTARLGLPELVEMQEMDSAQINDALIQIDALACLALKGLFVNDPPASPSDGDTYVTGGAPTGAWSGYSYKIAYCLDGGWRFFIPFDGLLGWRADSDSFVVYRGGSWTGLGALAETLTSKTINGAALAGTLSGNPTFSGAPVFSGAISMGGVNVTGSAVPANGIYQDAANHVAIATAGALRWVVGSVGNISAAGTNGLQLQVGSATATAPVFVPNKNDLTTGMGANAAGQISLTCVGAEVARLTASQVTVNQPLLPGADNAINLGSASCRWATVYAGTGTINTSDAERKTALRALSAAELAVAQRLAAQVCLFQYRDSVAAKGDGARLHAGMTAQDVEAAFADEGLDAARYGLFCADLVEGGTRRVLGLRYDELAQFVLAGLCARVAALEARP